MNILNEFETMQQILSGKSLSRYGDGEFKLIRGNNQISQKYSKEISNKLLFILQNPPSNLLVAVPRIFKGMPEKKKQFFNKYSYVKEFLSDITYGSSFVSRRDSAPHIQTSEFWNAVLSIFEGKNVYCIYGKAKESFKPLFEMSNTVEYIEGPLINAFDAIPDLLSIKTEENSIIYMSLGPTATCLAYEFAKKGIQAVDGGRMALAYNAFLQEKK
ncbi:MAG: DUF1792 domain-containing protein [Bacteroidales bacterium]|nr:DUF1792 domain-containing protein [Candidatus Cloacimonadota bacterium]MBS3771203.1 DUF1792 domain-containing protein [Bacteroidales bacterium]